MFYKNIRVAQLPLSRWDSASAGEKTIAPAGTQVFVVLAEFHPF
jgi:hypothetical protein